MKVLFTTLLLAAGLTVYAQTTVTLTEDLVLTETLVISESTNYVGNGFSLVCDGCDPAIRVTNGSVVDFDNVLFPKTYTSWIRVEGGNGMADVTWDSPRMKGYIRIDDGNDE